MGANQHTTATAPERNGSSPAVAEFATRSRDIVKCRVCGRTLLMGERSIGYFTIEGEGPFDVCELCVPRADRFGLRPQPSTPDELSTASRRRRWWPLRRRRSSAGVGAPPMGAAAIPVALAAFNRSIHARTLAGLYKTLGEPRASVVPRSPTDREVILTVAWEIVWYQFRIAPDQIEQSRGTYISELPHRWRTWNCRVQPDGKVAPPILDGDTGELPVYDAAPEYDPTVAADAADIHDQGAIPT